jgi:hypothetical protein
MHRRDISTAILASVTGAALLPGNAQSQTCTPPCFAQTPAETSAAVPPTNTADIPGNHPSGDVARYGCAMNGVTDDTAAFKNACKLGGELVISGPLRLESASLGSNGITLKSNTTIRCVNGGSIVVTGTAHCNVFVSINASNVKFIDVDCTGNSAGDASTGMFWWCQGTAAATGQQLGNFKFIRGSLTNFAALYWIYFDNTAATTVPMRDITIADANFTSQAGNAQGPTNIAFSAAILGFSGSDSIKTFETLRDCHVENCRADGTFIKTFVAIWSGTFRIKVSGNILKNFGMDSSIANDAGAYAMLAYDHSHGTGLRPDLIEFSNNIVDSVRSCGVYVAAGNRISILNNEINGQTDTVDASLAKGGIAVGGCQLVTIRGNTLDSCHFGITCYLEPDTPNDRAVIQANVVTNTTANGVGVKLGGTTGGNAPSIEVDGISIDSTNSGVTGVMVVATSTVGINNLAIRNFKINTRTNGVLLYSPDSTVPAVGTVHLVNGEVQGFGNYGILFNNCSSSSGRITIESIVLSGPQVGSVMLHIGGSVGLTIRNITFCDMTSGTGAGWIASNARGRLESLRYVNVAAANRYVVAGNDLGISTPAWTGADNDFVQDLNITELGAVGSKYVRLGWTFDTVAVAWKECRALTGN